MNKLMMIAMLVAGSTAANAHKVFSVDRDYNADV